MTVDNDKILETLSDGMKVTADPLGFLPNEMTACSKCGRMNARTRPACIYCGAAADDTAADNIVQHEVRPSDKPESWENGTNVVLRPSPGFLNRADLIQIIKNHCGEYWQKCADALVLGSAVPLNRVSDKVAASNLIERLDLQDAAMAIGDLELFAGDPPSRIRTLLEYTNGIEFIDFNTGEKHKVLYSDVRLIVRGDILESTVETYEKRTRSGKEDPERSRADVDRPILDLYTTGDRVGRRIYVGGFDFSFLGKDMALVAAENLSKLVERLVERSPSCRLDTGYLTLGTYLDGIWERDAESDPFARNAGVLNRKAKTRIRKTSNLTQFTKYSRLQAAFV